MKYLCLIIYDEATLESLPENEKQRLIGESLASDDTLRVSGHLLAAQALESVRSATTVQLREGKLLITDGPFAETREQVGGFMLIEAEDLDEAIRIASKLPPLRLGAVEIRPVRELKASSS